MLSIIVIILRKSESVHCLCSVKLTSINFFEFI